MPRSLRRALLPLLFAIATAPGGCFVYVPVGGAPPVLGARVRAELDTAAASKLVPVLGPGVTTLEGSLVQAPPQEFALAVDRYRTAQLGSLSWSGDLVRVHRAGVSLEERRFSRTRTLLFVGVIALTGYYLNHSLLARGTSPSDESQQPQNPF